MPDVHGLELIMTLQTRYPDAGIVADSATGQVPLDMAEALGATAALSKPVDPHELLEAIAKAAPESSVWASKLRPTMKGR